MRDDSFVDPEARRDDVRRENQPDYASAAGYRERPFDRPDADRADADRPERGTGDGYGAPPHRSEPPKKQGKTPGGKRILAWVAMALACILIGGSAGGLLVYGLMSARVAEAEANAAQGRPSVQTPEDPESTTGTPKKPEDDDETTLKKPDTSPTTNTSGSFDMAAERTTHDESEALTPVEINLVASPSVVAVYTEVVMGQDIFGRIVSGTGAGSGVIVSPDGLIVTNYHVIEGAQEIHVDLPNGQRQIPAELVGSEPSADLAVLKLRASDIPEDGLPHIRPGDSDKLQVGEMAVAIGNPLGDLQGSVTLGIVSALDRQVTTKSQTGLQILEGNIQVDAAINSGNSGGALVNRFGELIGINVAKASRNDPNGATVEGIGFAIPVNKVIPIVNDLVNVGYVTGKPMIGIRGRSISLQYREGYNMPAGVMVAQVEPGSGAEAAGIQEGDIIIAVDDEAVTEVAMINLLVNQKSPGDSVKLTVLRSQEELEITVELGEWEPAE